MARAVSENSSEQNPENREAATRAPGSMIGRMAVIVGLLWIAGSLAIAAAFLGTDRLAALQPVELAAIAGAALLPAMMIWFSGAAASEGARARAEASRLAYAADRLLNPEQSAEDAARRLAMAVRSEITTLDRALEQTLSRLAEVNGTLDKQTQAVDAMAQKAKTGAAQMILGMDRERAELLKISQDLNTQASAIGSSISRHTKVISEAARLAETEVHAADQALDHRITSFGAAAALITNRTHELSGAAQASADSALRLETALSNALDVLAKATDLTDAARQSAEQATLAANETAGAVRETTVRAIDDAKRAADVIRGEAVNVEREAASALDRLREAAEAARVAAINARQAAEADRRKGRQAEPEQRRPEPRPEPRQEPRYEAQPEWREPSRDYTPPPRREERPQHHDEPMFGEPARPSAPGGGAWTWRELLSQVDEEAPSQPQRPAEPAPRRAPAADPVARLTQTVSDPRGSAPAPGAEVIDHAGMRLHEVFSASALERIAQRARSGSQARRRAVKDAAPEAVRRLAEHLQRDARANQEAMSFLRSEGARIAELLARGRAAMNAEATRAFLLIDAAAG